MEYRYSNNRSGFTWGPLTIERTADLGVKGIVVTIRTVGKTLDVYVSPKGRSIRVFEVTEHGPHPEWCSRNGGLAKP